MDECSQCGAQFEKDHVSQKYCTVACRWDKSNGRDPRHSRARRETGFAWEPVHRPDAVSVSVPKRKKIASSGWKTAVVLPDPQIGFRRLQDGTLDPFHDLAALDVALQVVEAERPDLIVWLGDYLDLASFGRFRQEETFAMTTQPSIEAGYEIMAKFSALAGSSVLIEGNHDARLQNYITDNAMVAAGLRKAKEPPESWPVLSVPYLLRLDDLGVQYVGAYPSGAYYINDNLACIHGHKVKSSGSTAAEVVEDEQVSVLFGHVHRVESHYKTRNSRGRARFNMAHSPGTLSRIDGAVPSAKSAPALKTGRPAKSWEDWQQGLAVVRYEPEGDQRFKVEQVTIFEGWALHNGDEFTSAVH